MTPARWYRRLRLVIPLTLLVMVLMRLVWLQLRSYLPMVEPHAAASLALLDAFGAEGCEIGGLPPSPTAPGGGGVPAHVLRVAPTPAEWAARVVLASPAYVVAGLGACHSVALDERHIARFNQWLLMATVLLCTLTARFLTSSWTVALVTAAMLLSRGRLLADLGGVSTANLTMLVVTAWLTAMAHFVRTGARASLAAAAVLAVLAALTDRALVLLPLAGPVALALAVGFRRRLARPALARVRGVRRALTLLPAGEAQFLGEGPPRAARIASAMRALLGLELSLPAAGDTGVVQPSYERGTLVKTLTVPFVLWVLKGRRPLRLVAWSFGVAAVAGMAALGAWFALAHVSAAAGLAAWPPWSTLGALPATFAASWPEAALARLDPHLALSLGILLLCAVQSPALGLPGFLEFSVLTLAALALMALGAWGADVLDARSLAGLGPLPATSALALARSAGAVRAFVSWGEPVVLSLGVGGLYNLIKVLDTRLTER